MSLRMALAKLKMFSIIIISNQSFSLLGFCKWHLCTFSAHRVSSLSRILTPCESPMGMENSLPQIDEFILLYYEAFAERRLRSRCQASVLCNLSSNLKDIWPIILFPFKNQEGEIKANLTFTLLFAEVKIMVFLAGYVIFTFQCNMLTN